MAAEFDWVVSPIRKDAKYNSLSTSPPGTRKMFSLSFRQPGMNYQDIVQKNTHVRRNDSFLRLKEWIVEFAGSLGVLVLPLVVALYLLPTTVAVARSHNKRRAIFLLNFLLGWSVIGWIVAMAWAVTALSDKK